MAIHSQVLPCCCRLLRRLGVRLGVCAARHRCHPQYLKCPNSSRGGKAEDRLRDTPRVGTVDEKLFVPEKEVGAGTATQHRARPTTEALGTHNTHTTHTPPRSFPLSRNGPIGQTGETCISLTPARLQSRRTPAVIKVCNKAVRRRL